MTIQIALGDRSVNTCQDICLGGNCNCGVTCNSPAQITVSNDVMWQQVITVQQMKKIQKRKSQSVFSHHSAPKHGH